MSDNIPWELQVEIIKRVPVKAMLRFRSVSKQWKSLIDSPRFAADYCIRHSQHQRLLISYTLSEKDEQLPYEIMFHLLDSSLPAYDYRYVLVADDTFSHQYLTVPESVKNLKHSRLVGCCHGLLCFFIYDLEPIYAARNFRVVLWNPWIRKSVNVPAPNDLFEGYETILGFGVSPQTKDPKIVKISSFLTLQDIFPFRVEVFTLSSGTWKSLSCDKNNLPFRESIEFDWPQVALAGVIYWLAKNAEDEYRLIMSFDLSSETFEEVCLPDNLAFANGCNLIISKRMESLAVLEIVEDGSSCGVWMMGQGVTKTFTKVFTVMPRVSPYCMVRGFMKNGEPIVDHGSHALFAYNSSSEQIKDLRLVGDSATFSVKSYMETLLLIDQ